LRPFPSPRFCAEGVNFADNSVESGRAAISKFPQFFLPIIFAAGGRLSSQ
jgi:hypothetical protein